MNSSRANVVYMDATLTFVVTYVVLLSKGTREEDTIEE